MKKFNWLILILVVLFGAFLRLYKINDYFNFSGELGDNLLQARNLFEFRQFPLYGPATSHPWLFFTPYYYWMLIPIEILFKFNPLGAVVLGEVLGIGLILVNFITLKKIFNIEIALVSSFFMAISPLWLSFSQDARFYFWSVVFFYPLYYLFIRIVKEKSKFSLLSGLVLGLMLGFHYSPVIYIPIFLYVVKNKFNFIVGLIFPFIPLLIFDSLRQFMMFKNLLLWFPYRLAGFFRLYPKNQSSIETVQTSLNSLVQMVGSTFTNSNAFWLVIALFVIFILVYLFVKNRTDPRYTFLFYAFLITGLAAIIHGDSPLHYFLPVFPIPLIIISLIFTKLNLRRGGGTVQLIIILLLLINCGSNLRGELYSKAQKRTSLDPHYVPYTTQVDVAKFIVADSKGIPFTLNRVGPFDYFDQNYSQNYQYLLWYYGNKPQVEGKIHYIIVEDFKRLPIIKGGVLFIINDIIVIKS